MDPWFYLGRESWHCLRCESAVAMRSARPIAAQSALAVVWNEVKAKLDERIEQFLADLGNSDVLKGEEK